VRGDKKQEEIDDMSEAMAGIGGKGRDGEEDCAALVPRYIVLRAVLNIASSPPSHLASSRSALPELEKKENEGS
jgi:hypothetical protein